MQQFPKIFLAADQVAQSLECSHRIGITRRSVQAGSDGGKYIARRSGGIQQPQIDRLRRIHLSPAGKRVGLPEKLRRLAIRERLRGGGRPRPLRRRPFRRALHTAETRSEIGRGRCRRGRGGQRRRRRFGDDWHPGAPLKAIGRNNRSRVGEHFDRRIERHGLAEEGACGDRHDGAEDDRTAPH